MPQGLHPDSTWRLGGLTTRHLQMPLLGHNRTEASPGFFWAPKPSESLPNFGKKQATFHPGPVIHIGARMKPRPTKSRDTPLPGSGNRLPPQFGGGELMRGVPGSCICQGAGCQCYPSTQISQAVNGGIKRHLHSAIRMTS